MMNFATKEERVKSGSHGRFKAEHYKRIKNADIFIESSERQAEEIAELSGKLVFCTDTHKVYEEGIVRKTKNKLKQTKNRLRHRISMMLPQKLKRIIKRLIRRQ